MENLARAVGAIIQSVCDQATAVIFEFFLEAACVCSTGLISTRSKDLQQQRGYILVNLTVS